MAIKLSTFCSGIGSPEQALKNLGVDYESVLAAEIDKYARETYLANFKTNIMLHDMTKCDYIGEEYYSDINVSGLPCQSFSLAGKRLGELDPRGLLFYDFYRYVKNQQPKVFIIENVKGLLSDANGTTFGNWLQLLGRSVNTHINMFNHPDSLLYNLHWTVLNSKDFGVPQNRERVFLVGVRNDLPNTFRFPIGFRLTKRLKDVLEESVDEKYYLSEKMIAGLTKCDNDFEGRFVPKNPEDIGNCLTARYYKMGRTDNYIQEPSLIKAGQLSGSHESSGRIYSPDGLSPTITAKQGGGHEPFIMEFEGGRIIGRNPDNPKARVAGQYQEQTLEINENPDISNTLTTVGKDNVICEKVIEPQIYQRPRGNNEGGFHDLCPTISANSFQNNNHVVQSRIRRLTPLECMRLQAFPDSFVKPCSDSQTYKQAGNSITVSVMKAIIQNLLPILE